VSATAEPGVLDTRPLEALLFVSDEPLATSVLAQTLEMDRRTVDELCDRLAKELEDRGAGVVLRNVAGGWRLFTHPDTAPAVERFVLSSRQARLTKAALETLAIVAYKQPVTRHQVSSIRGVNSDGVLRALLGLPSLASLPSLAPHLGAEQGGVGEEETTPGGGSDG
jgi:segregation and condensation protein B